MFSFLNSLLSLHYQVCSVPLSARDLEKQTEKELGKWRKERPSSTFDPRGRCHGYRMAWMRAQQSKEEQDRKERERGNLSVPLSRSVSTLSLSPSLLHKRLRKGGKVNTGELEGGRKVVRHLSIGGREDWRSWNDFNFKRVQDVQEEDIEEHKKQSELKLTGQSEEKELLEEPKKMERAQNEQTEHNEDTVIVKEEVETRITEKEESQRKETEDDKMLSEQTEETNVETEPNQDLAKDEAIENTHQPTEYMSQLDHGEKLDSYSQSQVLKEQNQKDQAQETDVRDTKEETEKQVSESEDSADVEENQCEIEKDAHADTYADKEMQSSVDSSAEQTIQADMKPEKRTEGKEGQHMQMDTVTEVSGTRTETSPEPGTDSNIEAATTAPGLTVEIETQEEVIIETDKSSQDDAFEEKYHSSESFAETEIKDESNIQKEKETEEKVEENAATQDKLQSEIVQMDSEQNIDSKTETETEAEKCNMSSPECIQKKEDTDIEADTEAETEIPVADNRVKESSEAFDASSEKECDAVASEPAQEKEEISLTVQSETEVDNVQTQAEETPTEMQTNVETTDSVAIPEEETSEEAEEVNLTTEPDGETSSVEMSTSEEPALEEPKSQVTAGPLEEEESNASVTKNTVGEDDIFISTPNVTDNPHTDNNAQVQIKEDSPDGLNNSGLTQASGNRGNRSSGDICVRRPSSSRGSRLARRLSEDLFTAPQKTSQPQPIPNHPEVKDTESESNPGAVNPTQTLPDVIHASEVTSSLSTEVTEGTAPELGSPSPPKRFGLFRRLRGEQPKKAKEKGAQKMQVPKILIQDFSDESRRGKVVDEEGGEKLSSRERRRRRREQERREKEEERLRKKKEKAMEKERERERRKPQTRGMSFQVQKERGSHESPQPSRSGSPKLRYYASHTESYF